MASELLAKAIERTMAAWTTPDFEKIKGAVELEIEAASNKGRFWTVVVYTDKARAQAVVSWLRHQGLKCAMSSKDRATGKDFSSVFVTISWSPEGFE